MDEIASSFRSAHPGNEVELIYGSSGKFHTQIQQGAPFDIFFSADVGFARELKAAGQAISEPKLYAIGRIVLWSAARDASKLTLASLADPTIQKIAIANPQHAPYGKQAEEALRSAACGIGSRASWSSARTSLRRHSMFKAAGRRRHHCALPRRQQRTREQGRLLAHSGQPARAAGTGLRHHQARRGQPSRHRFRRLHADARRATHHDPLWLRFARRSCREVSLGC